MRKLIWTVAVAAILVAACGGGKATQTPATPGETAAATAPAATDAPVGTTAAPTPAPTLAANLPAGSIGYRILNQSDPGAVGAVDVYVRTQGVVQAKLAKAALAPGEVTDEIFPPDPGEIVVTRAGTGDPTCVSSCEFEAEFSTNAGEGSHRILIIRGGSSTEFWADPKAGSVGAFANALRPADPAKALVIIEAAGMADSSFGLRVSWGAGCAEAVNASGLMLGGTNVLAYAMDPAGGKLSIYDASDATCAGEARSDPFAIPAAANGSRTFTIVWGGNGSYNAVSLPLP